MLKNKIANRNLYCPQAGTFKAVFSRMWNFGDSATLVFHILGKDRSWHDAVRGDGHSYGDPEGLGCPEDLVSLNGETAQALAARAQQVMDGFSCIENPLEKEINNQELDAGYQAGKAGEGSPEKMSESYFLGFRQGQIDAGLK